jgi:undecaprenyl-diphosphatase
LFLTRVGGGTGMTILTAAGIIALLLARRARLALFFLVSAGGAGLVNWLLKLLFHRARPEALDYLIPLPSSFSFPSGHAMGSMGVLSSAVVVLYVLGAPRAVRVAALVAAALIAPGIALSRVYFGVHYPSDVIGGQLAAAAWVSAITGWFHPRLLPGEHATKPAAVELP